MMMVESLILSGFLATPSLSLVTHQSRKFTLNRRFISTQASSAPRSSWYRHIVLDTAATQIDISVQVYILESLHLPRQTQKLIWQKVSARVVKHRLWIRLSGFKSQLCYMWASMSQFPSLWNDTNNCTYLTELRLQPWFLTGSKYFRHLNHVLRSTSTHKATANSYKRGNHQ